MKRSAQRAMAVFAMTAGALLGQTQVDLRTQSKTVDFRDAQSTKPMKSGGVLPASCDAAEMFFLTSAPAGSNIFACPALNTWVLQSGGSDAPMPGGFDTQCQFNDVGTFGGSSGCTFNKNTKVLTAVGGVRSGDGTKSSALILPELAANGSSSFAIYGADAQSEDGCIVVGGSPSNLGDVLAYTGITVNTTAATPQPCKVMQWAGTGGLVGSSTLNFGSLNQGQCDSATFTVAGAVAGSRVQTGYPAGLESGLVGQMRVSAADTVTVQLCNFSGATIDPAPGAFSAAIF